MSVSAHFQYSRFNTQQVLSGLTKQQTRALDNTKAAIEQVLLATIGTQYYSLAQLRLMKHPYRHGGTPPLPPGIINKQRGDFYAGTVIIGPTRIGEKVVIQVVNMREDYAAYFAGTGRMVRRPYKLLLQSRLRRVIMAGFIKVKVAA